MNRSRTTSVNQVSMAILGGWGRRSVDLGGSCIHLPRPVRLPAPEKSLGWMRAWPTGGSGRVATDGE